MLFTSNSNSRSPRKVVFDSRKAQNYFLVRLKLISEKYGEDIASSFSAMVRQKRNEKIVSEENLDTFYLTVEDMKECEEKLMQLDHDCHAELGESGCTHWSHKENAYGE